jgi:S-DNA-T family DNA segregation ATPase FtsK/SpoIIIE
VAKRKATAKKEQVKERRQGKPLLFRLFSFFARPWFLFLLLLALVIAVIIWQWHTIINAIRWVVAFLGLGLLLIAIGLIVTGVWVQKKRFSSFFYHGNRWLGGIAFFFAVWGIISFWNLGGSFGRWLIGATGRPADFLSILRIAGIVLLGFIFISPRATWRLLVKFSGWISRRFKRPPMPRYLEKQLKAQTMPAPEKQLLLEQTEKVVPPRKLMSAPPEVKPEMEKSASAVPPIKKAAESPQDLRQVAEDVWKKYGQSSNLTVVDGWKLPPIEILDVTPEVEFSQADNMKRAQLIEESLASYGVEAKVVQINAGPTVTQFGVEPGWDRKYKEVKEKDKDGNIQTRLEEISKTRVKVERITSLGNDLALALAAPSIRIEAPVPGKSIVGIEVPNTRIGVVSLRSVIETSTFQKIVAKSKLAIALGKGAGGEAISADLSKMPHLLIAGATGSGKTVCLNAIICCLLMYNTPNDVRFIMIDPKRVEMTPYNSIPHLATPVIVETDKALNALRWLNQEMDQRYKKMAQASARNIEGYNKGKLGKDKMPYLVLVIDELADLMMTGFDEVEHILCRLAQLARATGIHLVVATQRPSVDVVTGLIKANFPTRISFAVTSQVDSRTILDGAGAEKLLGRGDMLYMPTEAGKPKRLQGCFVSDPEIERIVYFWNSQQQPEVAQVKVAELVPPSAPAVNNSHPPDPLLEQARQLAKEHERISTSFLQRRLHIGYPRAARLMDQLEAEGFKRTEEEREEPAA